MADRTLCRVAFVAFCLLPTTLVGGWAVVLNSSSYRRSQCEQWERQLSRQLGLRVQVDQMRRLRDGVIHFGQVALLNPANDSLIVQADNVRLRPDDGQWQCTADGIQVQQAQLQQLWQSLQHHVLLPAADHSTWRLRLQSGEATVQLPAAEGGSEDSQSLTDFRLTLQAGSPRRSCQLQFFWPHGQHTTSAKLEVARLRPEAGPARFHIHLDCDGPLPCRLLSADVAALCGPEGEFSGHIEGRQLAGKWQTKVKGRLAKVDLSRLAPHSLPIVGRAELELKHVQLDDSRLISATGRLSGGPGRVAAAALDALTQYVQVERGPASLGMLSYERLSCDFWLDRSRGLALLGACQQDEGSEPAQAILIDADGQPLLTSKEFYASPYALLMGLSHSAADPDVLQRRAPYPVAPRVAADSP